MFFVILGEVVHIYDVLIALGGLICIIGALLPIPGIPIGRRLAFLIFGVILFVLFFVMWKNDSLNSYPIYLLAAPLIAVIQLIKTIVEAIKNNKIARDPMLAYNLNQSQDPAYGQAADGYGVAPASAPSAYGDAGSYGNPQPYGDPNSYGAPAIDYGNPTASYGAAPQQQPDGIQAGGAHAAYGAQNSYSAPSPYSTAAAPSANSVTGGNYTVAHAADPGATPQTLSEIAATSPHLHIQLANNPATSPELLDWLAANGAPEVQQAVAYRRSQSF